MKNGTVSGLDERILTAFADVARPGDVEALIRDAEAAASEASAEADAARMRAMDPTVVAASVVAARKAMEDATFKSDRLKAAIGKLGERLTELRFNEENGRRQAAYDRAIAVRQELEAELEEAAPALHRLADLAQRVELSDREIKSIDRALPKGAAFLQLATGGVGNLLRGEPIFRDALLAFARELDLQRPPVAPVRLAQRERLMAGGLK